MSLFRPKITQARRSRAFSLIELMVAITIIGLLIAASTVSLAAARRNSRDSQRVSDLLSLNSAANAFISSQGLQMAYQLMPAGGEGICEEGGLITNSWGIAAYLPSKANGKAPTDPLAATDPSYGYRMYLNIRNTTAAYEPIITRAGSPVLDLKLNYMFSAKLENAEPPRDSDIKSGVSYKPASGMGVSTWDATWAGKVILPGPYCGSSCPNAISGGDNDSTGAPCDGAGGQSNPGV